MTDNKGHFLVSTIVGDIRKYIELDIQILFHSKSNITWEFTFGKVLKLDLCLFLASPSDWVLNFLTEKWCSSTTTTRDVALMLFENKILHINEQAKQSHGQLKKHRPPNYLSHSLLCWFQKLSFDFHRKFKLIF